LRIFIDSVARALEFGLANSPLGIQPVTLCMIRSFGFGLQQVRFEENGNLCPFYSRSGYR